MILRRLILGFILIIFFFQVSTPVLAEEGGSGKVSDWFVENEGENTDIKEDSAPNLDLDVNEENIVGEDVAFGEEPGLFRLFFQMVLALVFIIGLIYVMLRFVNKRSRSFTNHQTIQNIGGVSLGTNRSIQMVKVGARIFIVGVGESIQLLKEIDDQEEIEKLMSQQSSDLDRLEVPISKSFSWISSLLQGKKREHYRGTNYRRENHQFCDLLNKQLKDVSKSQRKIREAMKEHNNE